MFEEKTTDGNYCDISPQKGISSDSQWVLALKAKSREEMMMIGDS